ncbi:hypothetical protein HOD29_01125 [archaeon]|jgi:hypothetical protein|nr:hypothetical protein [archaeon]
METKQINLKLPLNLLKNAETYAQKFGFQNIQELTKVSLREKIYPKIEYDNTYSKKELKVIGKIVDKIMKKGEFVSEEELRATLSQ